MLFGLTLYQMCWYFIEYSFIGWIIEVIFHAVVLGKIVNRGFLNGPVCPVYGVGMLGVIMLTNIINNTLARYDITSQSVRLLCVFLAGGAFATLIELIASWMLDVRYHARWWDYSGRPFNFKGYICLEFSILWGLGILFVVEIIQPLLAVEPTHGLIAQAAGWIVLAVLYTIFITDMIVTNLTIKGLNKKLAEIDAISAAIHRGSDFITEKVGGGAYKTTVKIEEGAVKASLARAELKNRTEESLAELTLRRDKLYQEIGRHSHFGTGRLLRAFTSVTHERYGEALKSLLEKVIPR